MSLADGSIPAKRATPTRRVKQAIAEWYVLNMLELSWGGLEAVLDMDGPFCGEWWNRRNSRTAGTARRTHGAGRQRLLPTEGGEAVVTRMEARQSCRGR